MTELKLLTYPNPMLEKPCQPVKKFDGKLHQLLDDLYEMMMAADGIGIAAPQVGVDLQVAIVYQDDETGLIELINPKILATSSETNSDIEGCLSFPDIYGYVDRANSCRIQAQDRYGKTFHYEAEGYLARILQHEIDHLYGEVFEKKISQRVSPSELAERNAKSLRIAFMGTPDFSVPILERLIAEGYQIVAVVTQPDRPVGRKRILTPPPVKVAALAHEIPVLQPEKIREPAELEKLFAFEPDLIVTAAFGQILPKILLEHPEYGCINVHASLLPKLRGGAPIHHAIMRGDGEAGVTIMYMVERLDAGGMLAKAAIPIEETDHTGSLHEKLSQLGTELLIDTLPKLVNGDLTAEAQDETEVTFARNISREEEKLDWSRTGEEIYNQIRGLHPWPVAFTTLADKTIKVWWGEKFPTATLAAPGTIRALEADGIIVQTGNNTAIKLTDLQLAGKKRMPASEILRGSHPFQIGEQFK